MSYFNIAKQRRYFPFLFLINILFFTLDNANAEELVLKDTVVTTITNLRNLKVSSINVIYKTNDSNGLGIWQFDPSDRKSKDNLGTILVSQNGLRFKRIYTGAVHTKWFGLPVVNKNNLKAFQYIFSNFQDIYVDPGIYNVLPSGRYNIMVKNNARIKFDRKSLIRVIPNDMGTAKATYYLFVMQNVENVVFDGINLVGDIDKHLGVGGEWACGVWIVGYNNDIQVINANITKMWGDGLAIEPGQKDPVTNIRPVPQNILVDNFYIDSCGRNGISITGGKYITVSNGKSMHNLRTLPKAGIDIEPEGATVANVVVDNVELAYNYYGIIGFVGSSDISYQNLIVHDNQSYGMEITKIKGPAYVKNCTFYNSGGPTIALLDNSFPIVIDSCTFSNSPKTVGITCGNNTAPITINQVTMQNMSKGMEIGNSDVQIDNLKIQKTSSMGIAMFNYGNVTVNNSIISKTDFGLFVNGTGKELTVKNTLIENGARGNISIGPSTTDPVVTISDCTIRNGLFGVRTSVAASIISNKIYGNQNFGIDAETQSSGNFISQNQIYKNGQEGLALNSSNNKVESNQIYANGLNGGGNPNLWVRQSNNTISKNTFWLPDISPKPQFNVRVSAPNNILIGNILKEGAQTIQMK